MFKGKKSEYKILGVCSSKITNEDVKRSVDSICKSAENHGWKVLLFTSYCDLFDATNETAGESGIYMLPYMPMLDALVIMSESILNDDISKMLIRKASEAGTPVITVDREYEGTPCIKFDYLTTFEQIVRHVIETHGCRTVNFMAGIKDNEFSEMRVSCFRKVLAENNIPFDERRLGYGNFWEGPTIQAMDDFMATGLPLPEAFICCNDSMAITVCQYLSKLGVKVPDDVIVTGFDGIEVEKYYQPRLTTGTVDYAQVGISVMDMVEKMRSGENAASISIPYKMRIAQSCGCIDIGSSNACDKILKLYERVSNSEWHENFMFGYLRMATGCHTLKELAKVMGTHGDYHEWFCVNTDLFSNMPDDQRYHGVYTENMNAFMIRDMDTINSDGIIFPTKELLPNLESALEKYDVLFFSALHFMDEVLGYSCATIAFVDESIYTNRRRYISNTSQILENLINRVKLERANSELAEMHIHDPLTGLLNRRGFYKQFEKLAEAGKQVCVFSVDMDRLKYINDTFGHNAGDKSLRAIAAALISDTKSELVCSRVGGDEFTVIGVGRDFSPENYVRTVRDYLESYNKSSGEGYSVGVSFGWENADLTKQNDIDAILSIADERMYEDKRSRKALRQD